METFSSTPLFFNSQRQAEHVYSVLATRYWRTNELPSMSERDKAEEDGWGGNAGMTRKKPKRAKALLKPQACLNYGARPDLNDEPGGAR